MKFSKHLAIGIFAASTLALTACVAQPKQNQESSTTQEVNNQMKEMAQIIESGGSAYCKLTATDDSGELEYWIKGEKMKAVGVGVMGQNLGEEEMGKGYIISDGEYFYSWAEGEAEGVKMRMPTKEEMEEAASEVEEFAENLPDFSDETQIEEYEDAGYSVDCKRQDVADSEFTPPSNVEFTDFEAMMQDSMDTAMDAMKDADMSEEDIKAMMEQIEQ